MSVQTKRCADCREVKPVSEFHMRREPRTGARRPRSYCRSCGNHRSQRNWRERRDNPEHAPKGWREKVMLDAEPFARWVCGLIEAEVEAQRRWFCKGDVESTALTQVTQRTGLDSKTVYDLRRGYRRHVHIDLVDRTLIREGSLTLRDLYPSLYTEQEAA